MGRAFPAVIAFAALFAVALPHGGGRGQGLGLGGGGDKPIEVYAQDGIEWDQSEKRYIARGKARAIQGDTTVHGDTLIAYYDEQRGKGSEIYRIDALGHVKIVSPSETAYADKGVYDVRKGVLVLTGKNLRLVTKNEIVTARDSLEYYDGKGMAVARGNARLKMLDTAGKKQDGDRSVRADVLATHFHAAGKGAGKTAPRTGGRDRGGRIKRMEAFGNVVVTRPGEIAFGERGVYLPDKDTAELWGKVRITRGKNQLNGEHAIVNFASGKSRLLAGEGGKGSPPVRVLIVPKREAGEAR